MDEYIVKAEIEGLHKVNVVGKLVRCKDCDHAVTIDGKCYCDKPGELRIIFKKPEWFCADGIPKEET